MPLRKVLRRRIIFHQYKNWYVLNDNFSWNIETLYDTIFKHLDSDSIFRYPVIFCSICEANKIICDLGDEEDEYLRFASGVYWRELGVIFIFDFNEFIPLLETLFHEFRHVMQDLHPDFRNHFESDKKLPYQERITERDAFEFAQKKINEYIINKGETAYKIQGSLPLTESTSGVRAK